MVRNKKQTAWIGVLLAVLLLGGTGCADKAEETTDTQATAAVTTETAETQTLPTVPTEAPVVTKTVELKYWDVDIPDDMVWEEHTEEQNYWVDFGMMLEGEWVRLYSIHIGDVVVEKVLGEYMQDGVSRTVGVNTYSLSTQIILDREETGAMFTARMETLEDVVQAMALNQNFSVEIVK